MKKTIRVVGAIIKNDNNEILCALRSPNMSMPNVWEFPGGKVEILESLHEAIEREIREELLCEVRALDIFSNVVHEYDSVIVDLTCINCELVGGTPVATEHTRVEWVSRSNLKLLEWAPADIPSMELLVSNFE